MMYLFQSESLGFRPFQPSDAKSFFLLNKDWEVMKYTGDRAFNSLEATKTFISTYNSYDLNGFGRWTVLLKETKEILGWCGLKQHVEYVDLGYRYHQKYWGQGYGTEASQACINYAFTELKLNEIVGRTAEDNIGSIRVLEKAGMEFWKKDTCEGIPNAVYYRIKK